MGGAGSDPDIDVGQDDPPLSQTPQERADELIGQVVAERYKLDSVIAFGGMGAVYSGQHVHMRNRVAVKVLHPETENLPELVQRFERESIVGAHANHPNVASATDFGRLEDGSYYLVQEFIEGITLHDLMKRGPLEVERAVDIARQMAQGLDAIHKLDIVHRDLKKRNVMVDEEPPDQVKLIDFGFAKLPVERFEAEQGKAAALTSKGVLFGTVGYMAPEVTFGMHAVGPAADQYALGVILYEMLTGKHPFKPKDSKALFRCHQMDPPPPFHERAPDRSIPKALERITLRLLEKDPDERYPSAGAVVEALDAAMADPDGADDASDAVDEVSSRTEQASPAPAPMDVPSEVRRGSNTGLWALVGLLAAGTLGYYVYRDFASHKPSNQPSPSAPIASESAAPAPVPVSSSAAQAAKPSASASAAPEPEQAPRPSDIDGMAAAAWKNVLHSAAAVNDVKRGASAIVALGELDPNALSDRLVVKNAAALSSMMAMGDKQAADELFDKLASARFAPGGMDVLYQLTVAHGGSKGAARATELLARPDVLERASTPLKITIQLKDAPCDDKPKLLERAGAEGDYRTQLLLFSMRPPTCTEGGGCCLYLDPGYNKALSAIGQR